VGISRAILFTASPLTPYVGALEDLPPTSRVVARDGTLLAELTAGEARIPVAIETLPAHVSRALLAAEDEHFYDHSGVDPEAVFRALWSTARGKVEGGSTITQQLAKINYTAGERTVLRKLKEVLYASRLEKDYSKTQILERYLNQVYFGAGAYGIEAAARAHFGIPAAELSPAQAALLMGKLRAPEILDPRKRPEAVERRRDQVLRNMAEEGWLPPAALRAALAEPVVLAPSRPAAVVRAPHFVEFVKREARTLPALGSSPKVRSSVIGTAGVTIQTTLDPKVFEATVAAARAQLGTGGDPAVAAASVEPGDGAIRSLFGGLDFAASQFDPSSLGGRQPGSAFKPFVYLAALRQRIDPRSAFDTASGRTISCYGDKPVRNFSDSPEPEGSVDADTALARSVNVVFVDLGCRVGVDAVLDAAHDAGIPDSATSAQPAVFLGGLDRGVNALTLAAAYATFASGGMYAEPYAITEVRSAAGEVLYARDGHARRAFAEKEVGVLNAAMTRVVTEGTGRAAALGRPAAGKTGTTQGHGDAWFAGYVPQLSTAVWVGYEPRRPMTDVRGRAVTGGSHPALIFRSLMRQSLRGVPVKPLPTARPDDLDLRMIEPPTTTTTSTAGADAAARPDAAG
jgi:penicillin-binding protein 1A